MKKKAIRLILFAVGMAILTVLNSCLDTSNDFYDEHQVLLDDVNTIKDYLDTYNINAIIDSATGIFIAIHDHPGGYKPAKGGIIKAHYAGYTLDSIKFGSTYSTGVPVAYPLSEGIDNGMTWGFDLGIASISEGDSATFYIPSVYGYRNQQEGVIPPNSILVYTVRFLDIHRLEEDIELIDQYLNDHGLTANIDPKFGTRYVVFRNGTGNLPDYGDFVSTDYIGQLLDGTEFDNSYENHNPLSFTFGDASLIIGFELGLVNLHEGDSATFFVPSTYGYQEEDNDIIPPNSVLVFSVDNLSYTAY